MSPEAIRIAVAEAMGYTRMYSDNPPKYQVWIDPNATGTDLCDTAILKTLPNYTEDLNACAEFEKTLDDLEFAEYRGHLEEVTFPGKIPDGWDGPMGGLVEWGLFDHNRAYTSATALQRCEAFLRVRGKWVGIANEGGAK